MNQQGAFVASVLDEVRRTDWRAWAIPLPDRLFDYSPESVIPAFESLAQASSPKEAQAAYNEMLDAIGHNHSGTPYAAMAPATPLIAALVPHLGAGASAGMDVIADCVCWTSREARFFGPDNREHDLAVETLAAARSLDSLAQRWLEDHDDRRRRAAAGLLEVLAEFQA